MHLPHQLALSIGHFFSREKKNVRWKVPIDGAGASTPIIWKDKIFLLSVIDTGNVDPSLPRPEDQPKRVFDITHPNTEFKFLVIFLNRKNGKELWRREASLLHNSLPFLRLRKITRNLNSVFG